MSDYLKLGELTFINGVAVIKQYMLLEARLMNAQHYAAEVRARSPHMQVRRLDK